MKLIYFKTLLAVLLTGAVSMAQHPTLTYYGNGASSFGGPVGQSNLVFSDDGTTITGTFTKGPGDLNDWLVIYIDNGSAGRSVINGDIQDYDDANRVAISNRFGGDITFASGFTATHAISLNAGGFGGLWEIPATGTVGEEQLQFRTGVGAPANNDDDSFNLTFDWSSLGTNITSFEFVAIYHNPFGGGGNDASFKSNEFYGTATVGGVTPSGNVGFDAVTIDNALRYPAIPVQSIANTPGDLTTVKDWNDPATWAGGVIPNSRDYVQITQGSQVGIATSVTIDNRMDIAAPASVLVGAGNLTLNGAIGGDNNGVNGSGLGFLNNAIDPTGTVPDYQYAQFSNTSRATIESDVRVGSLVYIPAQSGNGTSRPMINNGRSFRFLASPITTTTAIRENWQVNPIDANFQAANPGESLGTQITGPGGTANGFDQSPTNSPSLFTFGANPANMNNFEWQAVENTNINTLTAGTPYRLFVRGDRNYNLNDPSNPPPAPNSDVFLQSNGSLVTAQFVGTGALNEEAGGFSFVGNPYQATVDFNAVDKTNINPNVFYIWDSNKNASGGYVTIDPSVAADARIYIKPWQSLFVQTIAAGPASMTFEQSDFDTAQDSGIGVLNSIPRISFDLVGNVNGNQVAMDEFRIDFNGSNSYNLLEDAIKFSNIDETVARDLNGTLLAIERRAAPVVGEVLPLNFTNIRYTDYNFNLTLENMDANLEVVLVDALDNSETVLVAGMNSINKLFDPAVPASIDASRFSLRFDNVVLSTITDHLETFNLYPNPSIDGTVTISGNFSSTPTAVTVTALTGREVLTATITNNTFNLNTSDLSSGVYLVTVKQGDASATKKLIVR
ncbi:MAG: T9SS type A sorting domain-containing protein [Nonlabens sp.]